MGGRLITALEKMKNDIQGNLTNKIFNIKKKVVYIISGFFSVFVIAWLIYFCTEFLERILWNQAVYENENSVTYDTILYFFWKIIHFLNNPYIYPIFNLLVTLIIGINIILKFETKQKKIYFGIPFGFAYILNILIGILGGYYSKIN